MRGDIQDQARGSRTVGRRGFCKVAAVGLGGLFVGRSLGKRAPQTDRGEPLLLPVVTGNSTEICLNSRVSSHSGLGGTATKQQISNVLWAAGRAPVTGSHRTIYLRTRDGTYIYDPQTHSLTYHSSQTVSNAFRINYDRELDFDAGVSYILALLASVSLWTGTQSQLASCPQISDLNFGIRGVTGLTDQLVAISSNASLPNPQTDGQDKLEWVISGLRLHERFFPHGDLTQGQLSQILWAGYGCTAHWTSNNRGGLTVPSWRAEYFLTGRIYVVHDKVWRYCNRQGSNLGTRDHRLELVQDADVRDEVRQALAGIPEAPCYVLLCLTESGLGTWYQRLETGFVAGGVLAQAGPIGLGCHFRAALSTVEQQALQQITQIPSSDYPHAVVAVGKVPWVSHPTAEAGQPLVDP